MASYSIPRSRTSTWIIMGRNQSTMHHNNWFLLLTFLLSLVIIVVIVLIARFFSDYLRRRHANVTLTPHTPRLDARAVASLPTFVYCSGNNNDVGESECIICLSEVVEGEKMKMLSNCKHYFHVKCIDMWLHEHSTCPICRADVKSDCQLLASPTMPARVGGARGEELIMAGVTVRDARSMLIMRSSFCRRLSMERGERRADHIMVDLERE
ncbi:RING-H2 finger protein ATL40-like [Phalaenopsis equestris]|uniref:RING-H2 finger protein ATL40-like n=1 Tax=Phalaenopsis equestris TaxID=78828 RepID=UPI0009E233FE|nr:RING-H2 finger protein ATL40-like [Phalaenopsis equestris]